MSKARWTITEAVLEGRSQSSIAHEYGARRDVAPMGTVALAEGIGGR